MNRPQKVELIIRQVCLAHRVTRAQILGRSRSVAVAKARFHCFALLREHTDMTLDTIGNYFGRDHSTVSHGAAMWKAVKDKPAVDIEIFTGAYDAIDAAIAVSTAIIAEATLKDDEWVVLLTTMPVKLTQHDFRALQDHGGELRLHINPGRARA